MERDDFNFLVNMVMTELMSSQEGTDFRIKSVGTFHSLLFLSLSFPRHFEKGTVRIAFIRKTGLREVKSRSRIQKQRATKKNKKKKIKYFFFKKKEYGLIDCG